MSAVRITSLTKTYRSGEIYTIALNNVSLTIEAGEFAAIVGASGCGKTTLKENCRIFWQNLTRQPRVILLII